MPTLNWLTRDEDLRVAGRVPYRLLEEDAALSAGEGGGNMLVQGGKVVVVDGAFLGDPADGKYLKRAVPEAVRAGPGV